MDSSFNMVSYNIGGHRDHELLLSSFHPELNRYQQIPETAWTGEEIPKDKQDALIQARVGYYLDPNRNSIQSQIDALNSLIDDPNNRDNPRFKNFVDEFASREAALEDPGVRGKIADYFYDRDKSKAEENATQHVLAAAPDVLFLQEAGTDKRHLVATIAAKNFHLDRAGSHRFNTAILINEDRFTDIQTYSTLIQFGAEKKDCAICAATDKDTGKRYLFVSAHIPGFSFQATGAQLRQQAAKGDLFSQRLLEKLRECEQTEKSAGHPIDAVIIGSDVNASPEKWYNRFKVFLGDKFKLNRTGSPTNVHFMDRSPQSTSSETASSSELPATARSPAPLKRHDSYEGYDKQHRVREIDHFFSKTISKDSLWTRMLRFGTTKSGEGQIEVQARSFTQFGFDMENNMSDHKPILGRVGIVTERQVSIRDRVSSLASGAHKKALQFMSFLGSHTAHVKYAELLKSERDSAFMGLLQDIKSRLEKNPHAATDSIFRGELERAFKKIEQCIQGGADPKVTVGGETILQLATKAHVDTSNLIRQLALDDLVTGANSFDRTSCEVFGLTTCSSQRSVEVLSGTQFVKHIEEMNEAAQTAFMDLTPEKIDQLGLAPTYQMTLYGETFYLSKAFNSEDLSPTNLQDETARMHQKGVIAYVRDPNQNGQFIPRLLYRSGADNLWRTPPVMKQVNQLGGGFTVNIGKGIGRDDPENGIPIRATTNLPFELRSALTWMVSSGVVANQANVPLDDYYRAFISVPKLVTAKASSPNVTPEFQQEVTVRRFDLTHMDRIPQADQPDFNRATRVYEMSGTNSGSVGVYRVLSQNGNYEYIFYEAQAQGSNPAYANKPALMEDGTPFDGVSWQESEAHPWLASVAYIGPGQKLTSFLTYADVLDPNDTDLSGADRPSYIPGGRAMDDMIQFLSEGQSFQGIYENDMVRRGQVENDYYKGLNQTSIRETIAAELNKTPEQVTDSQVNQRKGKMVQEREFPNYVRSGTKIPMDSPLVPTWNYRKRFPFIQEFQQWLSKREGG